MGQGVKCKKKAFISKGDTQPTPRLPYAQSPTPLQREAAVQVLLSCDRADGTSSHIQPKEDVLFYIYVPYDVRYCEI